MVQNAIQEWEIDPSKLIIKDLIIRSNRGEVHRGIYDGKDVNVKLISWMRDADYSLHSSTGLMQELAVWQNLDHPNVSKFVGAALSSSLLEIVNEDCWDCCIVEEYLPVGDLRSYISENKTQKLHLNVVVRLAMDVASGLSYLHSLNIVHRNIKPENLLLDKAHRVKISEFGVARVEAIYPSRMSYRDETSSCTAPEILSRVPYNRKCDVYSFGICLWEIYCCDSLYPNQEDSELTEAVVEQVTYRLVSLNENGVFNLKILFCDVESITINHFLWQLSVMFKSKNLRPEIPECCPSSLADVMTRCWDANPDKRPEMEEVLFLLEAIDRSKGRGMTPREQSQEGSTVYSTKKRSHDWFFYRMFCGIFRPVNDLTQ